MVEPDELKNIKDFIDLYILEHPEIETYNKFAQHVKVASSSIDDYVKGKRKPGVDIIKQIAEATHTSPVTLLKIVYPELFEGGGLSAWAEWLAEQIERLPNPVKDLLVRVIRSYRE